MPTSRARHRGWPISLLWVTATVYGLYYVLPVGPLVAFCCGAGLTLLVVVVVLVTLLVMFTEKYDPKRHSSAPHSPPPMRPSPAAPGGAVSGRPARKGRDAAATSAAPTAAESVTAAAALVAVGGTPLPGPLMIQPSILLAGRYAGTVWTIPAGVWRRSNVLREWPPSTESSCPTLPALAYGWAATLEGAVLSLRPQLTQQQRQAQLDGLIPPPPDKVDVCLEGANVVLVRECLPGRSLWWKRGPIEISHPHHPLLYGQQCFYLWAEHSFAKEQWHMGLQIAARAEMADHIGSTLQQYTSLCSTVQRQQAVPLPLATTPQATSGARGAAPAAWQQHPVGKPPKPRRGWLRIFGRGGGSSGGAAPRAADAAHPDGGASTGPGGSGRAGRLQRSSSSSSLVAPGAAHAALADGAGGSGREGLPGGGSGRGHEAGAGGAAHTNTSQGTDGASDAAGTTARRPRTLDPVDLDMLWTLGGRTPAAGTPPPPQTAALSGTPQQIANTGACTNQPATSAADLRRESPAPNKLSPNVVEPSESSAASATMTSQASSSLASSQGASSSSYQRMATPSLLPTTGQLKTPSSLSAEIDMASATPLRIGRPLPPGVGALPGMALEEPGTPLGGSPWPSGSPLTGSSPQGGSPLGGVSPRGFLTPCGSEADLDMLGMAGAGGTDSGTGGGVSIAAAAAKADSKVQGEVPQWPVGDKAERERQRLQNKEADRQRLRERDFARKAETLRLRGEQEAQRREEAEQRRRHQQHGVAGGAGVIPHGSSYQSLAEMDSRWQGAPAGHKEPLALATAAHSSAGGTLHPSASTQSLPSFEGGAGAGSTAEDATLPAARRGSFGGAAAPPVVLDGAGLPSADHSAGPSSAAQVLEEARATVDGTLTGEASGTAVDSLHGVNMLITRLGFEMLRAHSFHDGLETLLQKRLDDIKRPPYLDRLLLTDLDIGSSVPLVRSLKAVAGPANCTASQPLWPELLLEVAYEGVLSATITTKVELQKASLFNSLQNTLGKMQREPGAADDGSQVCGDPTLNEEMSHESGDLPPVTPPSEACATPSAMADASSSSSSSSTHPSAVADPELLPTLDGSRQQQALPSARRPGGLLGLLQIKRFAAEHAQALATNLAESLSRVPVQLVVRVTRFEGTLMLWVAPPPSDRLWYSFQVAPRIDMSVTPVLASRVLRFSAMLARTSGWVRHKIMAALNSQLVFPACGDLKLPKPFASLDALDVLPLHMGGTETRASRRPLNPPSNVASPAPTPCRGSLDLTRDAQAPGAGPAGLRHPARTKSDVGLATQQSPQVSALPHSASAAEAVGGHDQDRLQSPSPSGLSTTSASVVASPLEFLEAPPPTSSVTESVDAPPAKAVGSSAGSLGRTWADDAGWAATHRDSTASMSSMSPDIKPGRSQVTFELTPEGGLHPQPSTAAELTSAPSLAHFIARPPSHHSPSARRLSSSILPEAASFSLEQDPSSRGLTGFPAVSEGSVMWPPTFKAAPPQSGTAPAALSTSPFSRYNTAARAGSQALRGPSTSAVGTPLKLKFARRWMQRVSQTRAAAGARKARGGAGEQQAGRGEGGAASSSALADDSTDQGQFCRVEQQQQKQAAAGRFVLTGRDNGSTPSLGCAVIEPGVRGALEPADVTSQPRSASPTRTLPAAPAELAGNPCAGSVEDQASATGASPLAAPSASSAQLSLLGAVVGGQSLDSAQGALAPAGRHARHASLPPSLSDALEASPGVFGGGGVASLGGSVLRSGTPPLSPRGGEAGRRRHPLQLTLQFAGRVGAKVGQALIHKVSNAHKVSRDPSGRVTASPLRRRAVGVPPAPTDQEVGRRGVSGAVGDKLDEVSGAPPPPPGGGDAPPAAALSAPWVCPWGGAPCDMAGLAAAISMMEGD